MGTGDRMWAQALPSPWTWVGLPLASSIVLPSAVVFSPVCSVSHPLKPNSLRTCKLVDIEESSSSDMSRFPQLLFLLLPASYSSLATVGFSSPTAFSASVWAPYLFGGRIV